jgi:RNA polymerase sigma-70 factor (ECF subfamily)
MRAHEEADPAAIIAVLRADARLSISPTGLCWDGRDEITPSFLDGMGALGTWRCLPTRANGQPAVANYLRAHGEEDYCAFTVVVLGMQDGELTEMATFAEPQLFAAFGLPLRLE